MLIRLLVCGSMGLARLAELFWSRRNLAASGDLDEGDLSRRTYPLIVALHTLLILTTALRGSDRPRWPWLTALAGAQLARGWMLTTLGTRWNARGAVPRDLDVVTDGPYRYVRHPNYSVIVVELAALPLAFGLGRLAVAVSLVNGGLLAARIRDEERLLRRRPAWAAHFEQRKRFLPGLF